MIQSDSILLNDPINDLAKLNFNIDYIFPFQRLVITNIFRAAKIDGYEIEQDDEDQYSAKQLVLLPTGAGKSLCFMLPALKLNGITLVVFPLLSLIKDQYRRARAARIDTIVLIGGMTREDKTEALNKCANGSVKLIITNPETLTNKNIVNHLIGIEICHIVIDETHIVSEWGESFRPAYLELNKIIAALNVPIITAFTATASTHIIERVKKIIFPDHIPNIIYGNPDRENIHYSVYNCIHPSHVLIDLVRNSEKPLIVFSTSRTGTELTAKKLKREFLDRAIYFYHAGLSKIEKNHIEKWFFDSNDGILVATCAYGMGVDKANIRTVIHSNIPTTVESYLQESGRAGRDRKPAKAILIYSHREYARYENTLKVFFNNRFLSMINYSIDNKSCRREKLLELLNSKPEICSGCDVCQKMIFLDEIQILLLNIIRKNKRRMTLREFKYVLKGYKNYDIKDKQLNRINGFSLLKEWDCDFIEEALELMIESGLIKLCKNPFWKGLLTI